MTAFLPLEANEPPEWLRHQDPRSQGSNPMADLRKRNAEGLLCQVCALWARRRHHTPSCEAGFDISATDRFPAIADRDVGPLHGGPVDPVRGFLLTRISGMGGEGVVEGRAVNVLRVLGQMLAYGRWKVGIAAVRHGVFRNSEAVCRTQRFALRDGQIQNPRRNSPNRDSPSSR